MKKIFRYLAFAAALASCGSDEAVLGGGEQSEGGRPLEFIATMEGMQTRSAEVKTAWADGDVIGVKISTDASKTGLYSLNADGTVKKAIASVSWPASGKSDITAWYPFSKDNVKNKSIADQSGGYAEIDFLGAELKGKEFAEGVTVELPFKHLMTKVQCKLVAGDGITADDISGATVEFSGATYVTFSEGKVSGSSYYSVKPYKSSDGIYSALLVPHTDKEGYKFITVTVGGNKYYYKPAGGVNLEAGKQYNYKITVNKTGIVLNNVTIKQWDENTLAGDGTEAAEITDDYRTDANGVYHVFTADGLKAWAQAMQDNSKYDIPCTLENDITLPDPETAGGSNWIAVGDATNQYKGTFDGNGHTINNLTINTTSDHQGLIGYLGRGGAVKNLTINDANVSGQGNIGGFVGKCWDGGRIDNCHLTGNSSIKGTKGDVGGIIGAPREFSITNCHVSADCTVAGDREIGGIAGGCDQTDIIACYALCKLSGNERVSGIAGRTIDGNVKACYSFCKFEGGLNGDCGAMIGWAYGIDSSAANYWTVASGSINQACGSVSGTEPNSTKVDGTTVTWKNATEAMNTALGDSYPYRYIQQDGEDNPPVLVPAS